ncbi:hypothetical protein P3381_07800 [Vibrio parahaemolyticus]|uniref:antiviral RADAR system adenosine deaminase RdrB n=1 Tax=Vibrio alginolyticus TaxID=663 RepID=UPI003DA1BBD8|nr:hypothetical protein [Vibrio parahaemolyticus]
MHSLPLHWLVPTVLLGSDRLLNQLVESPLHSVAKEKQQKHLYRMALRDYQAYMPGRLRQEDIDLALAQWVDIKKPLDLVSVITKLRDGFVSWRGDRFEVKNEKLELWLALLAQIDPAWIIGCGYAELIDNKTISIEQVVKLTLQQCPNALPKRFDGEPVADNHVHLGGHGHYSLSMAAFALHLDKRPSSDKSRWPFRQEHSLFNSESIDVTCLPVLLHRLFGLIISNSERKVWDKKSSSYDWKSLNTYRISRHASEFTGLHPKDDISALMNAAANLDHHASWILITTAISLLLRRVRNPHSKKCLTAFIVTSSILRNYMVVSGVGLGDFVRYFNFNYRKPVSSINYREQSQLYDLEEYTFREFRISDSDYRAFHKLAQSYLENGKDKQVHFVYHFTRGFSKQEQNRRYAIARKQSKETVRTIQSFSSSLTFGAFPILKRDTLEYGHVDLRAMLRGFDVAGNENELPIEVFAPALRVLRNAKHKFRFPSEVRLRQPFITLHAGEDFSHILSGLRAVDEAVRFCEYQPGDRIGHGLALGVDVHNWISRQQHIYLPLQEHLDNLVWCYHIGLELVAKNPQFQPALLIISEKIRHFCVELHNQEFSPRLLYQAWQMRRNCPITAEQNAECLDDEYLLWVPDAKLIQLSKKANPQSQSKSAYALWQDYLIRRRHDFDHDQIVSISYEKDISINRLHYDKRELVDSLSNAELDLIQGIQDFMLEKVSQSQWILEACPTSNIYIGRLNNYHEHPIFRWTPPNRENLNPGGSSNKFGIRTGAVRVCINTDDAGLMPTTLENEHRVIKQCAMTYESVSESDAHQWIETIRRTGVEVFRSNHLNWSNTV